MKCYLVTCGNFQFKMWAFNESEIEESMVALDIDCDSIVEYREGEVK